MSNKCNDDFCGFNSDTDHIGGIEEVTESCASGHLYVKMRVYFRML